MNHIDGRPVTEIDMHDDPEGFDTYVLTSTLRVGTAFGGGFGLWGRFFTRNGAGDYLPCLVRTPLSMWPTREAAQAELERIRKLGPEVMIP